MTQTPSSKDHAEKHRSRGFRLLQRGATTEATEQFRRVVKAYPKSASDRMLLAQALWKAGRLSEAEAEMHVASELSPGDADIYAQLGRLAAQGGKRVQAAVHFEKAIALDPWHPANTEWLALRGQISQSIHSWHLPMLADSVRNDAFQAAIEAAVSPDDVVLDIGTGTGLLAMMAARAGARQVIACEALPDLAELARLVIDANGFGDRIVVVPKQSTDLGLGSDMPERATLLVSETFDALLVGEGAIEWFAHAREHLLQPGAKTIPAGGTLRGQLVSLPRLKRMHPLESVSGFDLRPFAKRALEKQFYPVRLETETWTALSEPFDIIKFDFQGLILPRQTWSLPVEATSDGTVDALLLWFDLQLDNTIRLTSGPGERRSSHWDMVVFLFDNSHPVTGGTMVQLRARMGNNVFYFEDLQAWSPQSLPMPKLDPRGRDQFR